MADLDKGDAAKHGGGSESKSTSRPARRRPATSGTASRNSTRRSRAGGCGPSTALHRVRARLRRALSGDPARAFRDARACSAIRRASGWRTRSSPRRTAQAGNLERVASTSLEDIAKDDPELNRFAVAGGRSAFLVNCVQCHGSGAAGSPRLPEPERRRLAVGRHAGGYPHDDHARHPLRAGPRYAHLRDAGLRRRRHSARAEQIKAAANYVLSLSGQDHDAALADDGQADLRGQLRRLPRRERRRRPRRSARPAERRVWLYGSDEASIDAQITKPRHGVMPAWADRLSPTTIKELALFVYSLGGGEAARRAAARSISGNGNGEEIDGLRHAGSLPDRQGHLARRIEQRLLGSGDMAAVRKIAVAAGTPRSQAAKSPRPPGRRTRRARAR